MGEPPATPQTVGLMLCTATAPAAAAAPADPAQASSTDAAPAGSDDVTDGVKQAHNLAAATEAADAGSEHGQLAASAPGAVTRLIDSHAALHTAGFAALGLGPSEQAPLFTRLHAKIASSQALSVNHFAVQLDVECCNMISPAAPAQQVAVSQQEHTATTGTALATSSPTAAEESASTDTPAATDGAAEAADGNTAVRRSARLAATAASSQAAPVALTPLHHLYAAVTAAAPVAAFDDDDEEDQGQYLALWVCGQGETPAPFTGDEGQVRTGHALGRGPCKHMQAGFKQSATRLCPAHIVMSHYWLACADARGVLHGCLLNHCVSTACMFRISGVCACRSPSVSCWHVSWRLNQALRWAAAAA